MGFDPRRIPFRVQVASGALFTLLFILWVRNEWGGPWATVVFANVVSTLVPAAAAWACFERATRAAPELRTAWMLLGASAAAWSLGQLAWSVIELSTGQPPGTPSIADAGYLVMLPLAAAGVAAFGAREGPYVGRFRSVLDGAIAGSSFMFIAFVFGLEATLLASASGDLALIINLLYPFGDALVFGLVLERLSRAPSKARPALMWLAIGFVLLAIADLWFLVVDAEGDYATGGLLDAFWIMGFQCMGLAAVRPGNLEGRVPSPRQSRAFALLPLYPFFFSTVAAIYAHERDGGLSETLFYTALTVVLLVVVRSLAMVIDNAALATQRQAALASLQDAQAQRTQMLNNVTHDLLSPLSAVRIQLKLLGSDEYGPKTDAQGHAIEIVHRNVERVHRLGTDLKDMANLQGEGMSILPAPFDLAAELRRAAAAFEADARQRGVDLHIEAPPQAPLVGDEGRIGQVLDNLLSNALKFTPKGGRVTVSLTGGNPSWGVTVQDTGRGLGPDEIGRLFRPFSQVHQPGEIKERGTGLGLYISKGIVERHGGSIVASSPGLGKGATFRFDLPVKPRTGPQADPLRPGPGA